jgi:hypothetical protein
MRTPARVLLSLVAATLCAACAVAQADQVLLIEKSKDRARRDRIARLMQQRRMDVRAESMSAKELAKLLAIAMNDELNFAVFAKDPKDPEWPELGIDLRHATILNVLGVVQSATDLRFVYRDGIVLLKPKDEVNELKVLRVYRLGHAVAPLRDHPGPRLGLGGVESFDDVEADDSKTLSGFTLETLEDLVRRHVEPDSWDGDGVSISTMNRNLLIRQTERVHAKIGRMFHRLGIWSPPGVTRRVRVAPRPAKAPPIEVKIEEKPAGRPPKVEKVKKS